MTGASPAVTEAGEKSEEIGKPEVVETEHSEAEAKQPEEGVKSALQFGTKLAGEPARWAFDGQGSGDAQARAAIYNAVKGFVNSAGVNPAAYGAAPSQGPMGSAVPALSFGGFGKALGTPNVDFDSSGPQFAKPKAKPAQSAPAGGKDPAGDKPKPEAPGVLSQAMELMGQNPGYTAAAGLGTLGLGGALYYATRPKKKNKEEDGIKSAANFGKMLGGLMQTPAQAGQKAMMAARRGANGLSRPPAGMLPTPDYSGKYNRMLGQLNDPHIGGSSRDDLAVWAQNHADAMVPKYTPRRDALSEVGQTAARRQGLTQAGVLGGAAGVAGLGALSQAGQQAPPPEVKAKQPMTKAMSPSEPTPITPTSLFQRATGIYPK
jgi:hypothetical protein